MPPEISRPPGEWTPSPGGFLTHYHLQVPWCTRGQIANTCWIIKKAREFQKNIYFCFILHTGERPYKCTAAATAKLLQSCPTLCDPIDSSPPGSTVPGILQARTLDWVYSTHNRALFQITAFFPKDGKAQAHTQPRDPSQHNTLGNHDPTDQSQNKRGHRLCSP